MLIVVLFLLFLFDRRIEDFLNSNWQLTLNLFKRMLLFFWGQKLLRKLDPNSNKLNSR